MQDSRLAMVYLEKHVLLRVGLRANYFSKLLDAFSHMHAINTPDVIAPSLEVLRSYSFFIELDYILQMFARIVFATW